MKGHSPLSWDKILLRPSGLEIRGLFAHTYITQAMGLGLLFSTLG